MEEVYWRNLNDIYVSMATGSEGKSVKNDNEEKIFKAEDKLYELDTQIDNIEKCYNIILNECSKYELLNPDDKKYYRFPFNILNPQRFYWDTKFKKGIQDLYFNEKKELKSKDMQNLKKAFKDKLDFLKT